MRKYENWKMTIHIICWFTIEVMKYNGKKMKQGTFGL